MDGVRAFVCGIIAVARENPSALGRVRKEDPMAQESANSKDGTPIAYWRSGEGPPLVQGASSKAYLSALADLFYPHLVIGCKVRNQES